MLRFFRINDPYRLVAIFLILILLRIIQSLFIGDISFYGLKWMLLGEWLDSGFQMYRETFDYTGPLAAFVYKYLHALFGRSFFVHAAVSSLLITYQAAIFNTILLRNKAYAENSYVPAFLYMIVMISVPDLMALSPQLMSLTFILLAVRYVLRRIDNQATDELFLNSGIFTGIAAMIYLPAAVFFIVFFVALILFSTAVIRRLLLYLFTFLMMFVLCGLYFYWRGDFELFVAYYFVQNSAISVGSLLTGLQVFYLVAGLGFIFLIAVFKTWSRARMTNFQAKIQQVIWLVFIGGVATFFLSNEKSLHELVFLMPAVAYFWTHYFFLLRKPIWQTVAPILLVFGLIGYSIFSLDRLTGDLTVTAPEEAPAQRTLVLDEQFEWYLNQPQASPFFARALSDRVMKGLDYYQEASNFYVILTKVDPVYIQGDSDKIKRVFERFPTFAKKYRQVRPNLYQKISN